MGAAARAPQERGPLARRSTPVPARDRPPDRSLDALHAHADALAEGDDRNGGCWAAHAAVLDRLAAMRRGAEEAGWTALAIERDGPAERFRLFGVPPRGAVRAEVPDPFGRHARDGER
jgi:hypothetical protein